MFHGKYRGAKFRGKSPTLWKGKTLIYIPTFQRVYPETGISHYQKLRLTIVWFQMMTWYTPKKASGIYLISSRIIHRSISLLLKRNAKWNAICHRIHLTYGTLRASIGRWNSKSHLILKVSDAIKSGSTNYSGGMLQYCNPEKSPYFSIWLLNGIWPDDISRWVCVATLILQQWSIWHSMKVSSWLTAHQ